MAQTKYSVNLSSADFTLSHSFKGKSVIVQGQDQNYFQGTSGWAGNSPQRGINIPQIEYCENTVPTAEGYRSVAYKYYVEPADPAQKFVRVLTVFDGNASSAIIGITYDRKLFILSLYTLGKWKPLPLPAGVIWNDLDLVTTAMIAGKIYLCIEKVAFLELDVVGTALTNKNPAVKGLDPTKVKGICGSYNYTIAFDDSTIYWSSTEDGLDFIPSLITGAGSAKADGVKGKIVFCKEIKGGFLVYCEASIVSAAYSSNLAIPWIFDALSAGAGIKSADAVTHDLNVSTHFVWTSAGLLGVELHQAKGQFPQLTDFIASGLADKTTSLTGSPVTDFLDTEKYVRLAMVSSRYLCISFGVLQPRVLNNIQVPDLRQSFVYDLQLARWGKLNIKHVQIFEAPFAATPPVFF